MSSDQFNIRWNNYTSVLQNVFRKLLEGEQYVDVTLACEGQSIKCHRLILSACSTYFDRIMAENPTANLVIYLKDMKFWELRALVTFMYNGEVSISQQKLPHLCKAAEALKIKGLAHDTGYSDNMDDMEDEDIEDNRWEAKDTMFQRNPVIRQPKSLLRHNNSSFSATGAAGGVSAAFRQPTQQVKRKILSQPPKLVKMQRIERGPSNGSSVGSPPKHSLSNDQKLPMKKAESDGPRANNTAVNKTEYKEEEEETYPNEVSADSSMNDDMEAVGEENDNDDMDGGEENESVGSEEAEGEETHQEQAGRPNKVPMKYEKEVRDSAITALQSGMTLRQCSETYGIPRKTLSKWKSREQKTEEENSSTASRMKDDGGTPMVSTSGVVLPPKTTMGAPVDSADRAERLKKATELALSGVTVRQAAAHFEIPRTTLCAYMKRRGLAGKRNFLPSNGQSNNVGSTNSHKRLPHKGELTGESNGQTGVSSHYEDFPFLGISELMDEMGQGGYEATEEYAEGEEEYSEK